MRVAFRSSTHTDGFASTVVRFAVDGGAVGFTSFEGPSQQLALYLFFTDMAKRCPEYGLLEFYSRSTPATEVFTSGRIYDYEADNFRTKPPKFREELKTLNELRKDKHLTFRFHPVSDDDYDMLGDPRGGPNGGSKGGPGGGVPSLAPGDPDEGPWRRDHERASDMMHRAIQKDR